MSRLNFDDPLAGTPYRTLGWIGSGGMGEIVEAEHAALGRRVVIKLLHRHLGHRRDMMDRMRLEAQALGRVEHPNVVAPIDFGVNHEGRPYLVMERLRGRTLRDELAARGSLPAADAVALIAQALDGLAAVHRAGLCHRDVKPENIFVCDAATDQGRTVKVLDLGLAKVMGAAGVPPGDRRPLAPPLWPTAEDISLGTPRFFSPEQATGAPVDARSDIYAMGAVLYALVAGRGPFDHLHDIAELLAAHAHTTPEPPSRWAPAPLSPALEATILTALEKRPADRFPSATAFAAALRANAAPLVTAHPTPAPTRPAPRSPRLVPLFFQVLAASFAVSALCTAALRAVFR